MSSEIKTLLVLLFTWSYFNCFAQEQSFEAIEQSLFQQLQQAETKNDSVDAYNELAFNYRRTFPRKVLAYADKAIGLGQRTSYTKGLALAHKNKGIAYYKLGNARDSAIFFFEQAKAYAERIDDYYTIAACANNIGLVQMEDLEFNQAIRNYLHSLSVQSEKNIDAPHLEGIVLANLAKALQKQGKITNALEYYKEAMEISVHHDIKIIRSVYSEYMASAYLEIGEEQQAIQLLEEATVIQDEIGDDQSKVKTLLRQSEVQLKREKPRPEAALNYATDAYNIAKTHNFDFLFSTAFMAISKCYLQLNDIDKAKESALLAYETLVKSDKPSLDELRVLKGLTEISVVQEDYQAAYKYQKQIEKIQQSFKDAQTNRITSELEAIYQNGEKLSEIAQLEQDALTNRWWIRMMSVFLLIVALLCFFIFLLYNRQNKLANTLKQKNHQITIQSEELQKLSELKDKLFSTISHDLKGPIANFEQALQYLLSGELSQRDFLLFAENLKQDATQLKKSVEELMNWSYMQIVGLQPQPTPVNLYETVEKTVQAHQKIAETKQIHLKNQLPKEISVVVDQEHLNSILRNLTSNAVKFSNEKGMISFRAYEEENRVIISVQDQGIGIETEKLKDIFQAGSTTWGTAGEKGTGLGLALCKEFVEQNGGKIWVESKIGKGSTFYVALPNSSKKLPLQSSALSNAAL